MICIQKKIKTYCLLVLTILLFSNTSAQFTFSNSTVNTSKNGIKSVRLLNGVTSTAQLSTYGGNNNVKIETTGFFQIKKVNDVWYLLDPDGYLFFTVGVNSVEQGGEMNLPEILWEIGANTLGCWSDEAINEGESHKMPYCPRWNFMSTYKNKNQRTKDLFADGIIPVFDPEYTDFCDNHAQQLEENKDDPYLLGHFSDNELPIYDNTTYGNLLDRFLAISDKSDPNYLAAKNWIEGRKGQNYSISDEDRELFHGFVTGTYYKITSEAIKRYDPNHLYLGSRLHGAAKRMPSIYIEAAKYVDMISINVYSTWTPSSEEMDMWSAGGKPFFVTEFYAKAEDSGLGNATGAGWLVPTQDDRAKFFENFTLALIEHPGCVGYHYFRYIDNNDSNKGLLDVNYNWWEPMKNSFYKVARDIYGLREFFTGKITGNNKIKSSNSLKIYSDSVSGKINVTQASPNNLSEIKLYSLSGALLDCHSNIELPFSFNWPSCPAGLYIVKVNNDLNSISNKIFKY